MARMVFRDDEWEGGRMRGKITILADNPGKALTTRELLDGVEQLQACLGPTELEIDMDRYVTVEYDPHTDKIGGLTVHVRPRGEQDGS